MNMDHLYYFKTLVETKSRTETAEKLAITPSTLSLAISKLERELNTTLIDKKRGSVALTTEGEVFYEYIATALRFVEGGVKILNERGEGTSQSEIVIGTVFSVQDKDWSNIISKFRNYTHGGVRIKVKQATTPDLLNAIKNGTVDLHFAEPWEKTLIFLSYLYGVRELFLWLISCILSLSATQFLLLNLKITI